jgi:hypothetical protein
MSRSAARRKLGAGSGSVKSSGGHRGPRRPGPILYYMILSAEQKQFERAWRNPAGSTLSERRRAPYPGNRCTAPRCTAGAEQMRRCLDRAPARTCERAPMLDRVRRLRSRQAERGERICRKAKRASRRPPSGTNAPGNGCAAGYRRGRGPAETDAPRTDARSSPAGRRESKGEQMRRRTARGGRQPERTCRLYRSWPDGRNRYAAAEWLWLDSGSQLGRTNAPGEQICRPAPLGTEAGRGNKYAAGQAGHPGSGRRAKQTCHLNRSWPNERNRCATPWPPSGSRLAEQMRRGTDMPPRPTRRWNLKKRNRYAAARAHPTAPGNKHAAPPSPRRHQGVYSCTP